MPEVASVDYQERDADPALTGLTLLPCFMSMFSKRCY